MSPDRQVALAIAAHPDDIEFVMAGTLILLKQAAYEIHYMNIANGCCGTAVHSKQQIIEIRRKEAESAAKLMGAVFHPSLVDDMSILYEKNLLAQVAAVVREVNPTIMLVPSPEDYMEDHINASRLAVSAAFSRGMPNFPTTPGKKPVEGDVTIYHAMPAGLWTPLRRRVMPEYYVDISSLLPRKRDLLALHRSQKDWLDLSQGMDAYLTTMERMAADVGRMSSRFEYAEGWRRRSHLGFCEEDADPLADALGPLVLINEEYRRWLDAPAPG